ncbi:MAG TPA: PadR family transcriptional regulator [Planctomycetaceae bacterium]|nr:PadR family transcriptional regulator [Planctomycetaceae bacterium]
MIDPKLFSGTLDMLLLRLLSQQPSYGYEIAQRLKRESSEYFELKEGSLYPALHRLEHKGLLQSYWEVADGRRRKYYKVTAAGRKSYETRHTQWHDFVAGVAGILGGGHG